MQYEFLYGGKTYPVNLEKKGGVFAARIGEREYAVDACRASDNVLSFIVDGRSVLVHMARAERGWVLGVGGRQYFLEDPAAAAETAAGGAAAGGDGMITAPMPGKIVEVLAEVGASVAAGQPLLILESMKMQNEIKANVAGTVKKIHFSAGGLATFGEPLVEIEPAAE